MVPHFSNAELECKCGCGMLPTWALANKLEGLRIAYGRQLKVTSAARCPTYNAKVSLSGLNGPHTTGEAVDIAIFGKEAWVLLAIAFSMGFTGIGVSQKGPNRFIHLDTLQGTPTQPRPTIWSY